MAYNIKCFQMSINILLPPNQSKISLVTILEPSRQVCLQADMYHIINQQSWWCRQLIRINSTVQYIWFKFKEYQDLCHLCQVRWMKYYEGSCFPRFLNDGNSIIFLSPYTFRLSNTISLLMVKMLCTLTFVN